MVVSLLKAGREEAESYQNAAYCEQTLQIAPEPHAVLGVPPVIQLPRPPFRELKSVTVYLADGTTQDITAGCTVDDTARPAELHLPDGGPPADQYRRPGPLTITYTAGYDVGKVPERVKQAILLYAAWGWMHRGGDETVPDAFYNLLRKGRVVPV